MKHSSRKNIAVILAFLIPILFIGIVLALVYIPPLMVSTQYDFIYASCDNFDRYSYNRHCGGHVENLFVVESGLLTKKVLSPDLDSDGDNIPDVDEGYKVRLFRHDTNRNESKEVAFEDVQSLELDPLITSPDGVSLTNAYDRGAEFFLLFHGGSEHGYYLTKSGKKRKVDLINSSRGYYGDAVHFIGWVINE